MSSSAAPSERDLRTLAGIVSDHRADLPKDGLPLSLLAELMSQIRCEIVAFHGYDSERENTWFLQHLPGGEDLVVEEDWDALFWQHYWNCQPCSYPDRAGDLRSIVKISDFYSSRQWHSTGMYYDICRSWGWEHDLMLTLPAAPSPVSGTGRTLRLFFFRGAGPDFSDVTGPCWCWCARHRGRASRLPIVSGCILRRDDGPDVPDRDEFAGPSHLVDRSDPWTCPAACSPCFVSPARVSWRP